MNIQLTDDDIINLLLKFEYLQESIFSELGFSIKHIDGFKNRFKTVFYSKPFVSSDTLSFDKSLNGRSITLKFSDTQLLYLKIMNAKTNQILLEIK